MYKNHLYLVNGEGNDRETALHGTLVYIVTIYDVITKTARVLCRTYSCPYCIVYICGEWVIYAEPVTYWICNAYVEYVTNICYVPTPDFLYVNLLDLYIPDMHKYAGRYACHIPYSGKFSRVQIFVKIPFPLQKKFSRF